MSTHPSEPGPCAGLTHFQALESERRAHSQNRAIINSATESRLIATKTALTARSYICSE
jgi:hypothetical protein